MAFVGHDRTTSVSEALKANCGGERNEMLNIVPLPFAPPLAVVPYNVLFDKSNPPCGLAPSLFLRTPAELVLPAAKL
jgi:hypothetical protein